MLISVRAVISTIVEFGEKHNCRCASAWVVVVVYFHGRAICVVCRSCRVVNKLGLKATTRDRQIYVENASDLKMQMNLCGGRGGDVNSGEKQTTTAQIMRLSSRWNVHVLVVPTIWEIVCTQRWDDNKNGRRGTPDFNNAHRNNTITKQMQWKMYAGDAHASRSNARDTTTTSVSFVLLSCERCNEKLAAVLSKMSTRCTVKVGLERFYLFKY